MSEQNGGHMADDIFKCVFLNNKYRIAFKFHWRKGAIANTSPLAQVIVWHRVAANHCLINDEQFADATWHHQTTTGQTTKQLTLSTCRMIFVIFPRSSAQHRDTKSGSSVCYNSTQRVCLKLTEAGRHIYASVNKIIIGLVTDCRLLGYKLSSGPVQAYW